MQMMVSSITALQALQAAWSPTLFTWSGDPCNDGWTGVGCDNSNTNVLKLSLPSMNIMGILPADIAKLVNLQVLDLSYNGNLTGNLPTELFQLKSLTQLLLQNCGFFGPIPNDLGNLTGLQYLALNNNYLTGQIPDSISRLSKLFWFDISNNQLSGNLPSALSNLTTAKHFHLQNNNFSGIANGTFTSQMTVIHLLLNNNSFQGPIPGVIGSLPHLDILRLDYNKFTSIPDSLTNLTTLSTMQLDHNAIVGSVPDLSDLTKLQILDLGHNQFASGLIPPWVTGFSHLQYLGLEADNLEGEVPANLFSPSNLTTVYLGYNSLNGTLDLANAGPNLAEVDVEQNRITSLAVGSFSGTLNLQGNLVCEDHGVNDAACSPPSKGVNASMQPSGCGCHSGLTTNPSSAAGTCLCSYPVSGVLIFIALKVTLDARVVPTLQSGFAKSIPLVSNQNQVSVSPVSDVVVNISIYPNNVEAWSINEAHLITSLLSSKGIVFAGIGPYEYLPFGPYIPPGATKHTISGGIKIAVGVGVVALAAIIIGVGGYAFLQKKRADKAEEISRPFASWMSGGEDKGGAPKVKGARLFSLPEVKKATNNFSRSNEIGSGGYGKVYKGILPSGEQVAIKKAQASSQQGAAEFKNEIELLSRVHHKNLVGLMGFCFEEQMLVYEFMANGTLRESLSGRTKVKMDWQRRLNVALGSARGLAYLHTEADPPIIHRDIKSSNILLDEKLVAKVADFGLSKLAPDDEGTGKGHVSTQVKGTLGYLDPEYYTSQRLTEKSDVYSFGIVLLELLTSKQPIENGKFIVREVRNAIQKGGIPDMQRLVDPQLVDCPIEDVQEFLDIALRCVEEEAALRPTMKQVAKELETLLRDAPPKLSNGHGNGAHFYYDDDSFGNGAALYYGKTKKAESFQYTEEMDSPFQYSGGFHVPVEIEPK